MPKKARKPGFATNDLQLNPYDVDPSVADEIGQSVSYLLGWHDLTDSWKSVLVDVDGRVLVSSSPTQSDVAVSSQAIVGVASGTILASNPSRKQYIIQNLGATAAYIGFGNAAVVASSLQIPAGGTFADDVFTGLLTAIVASGTTDLRIVEM